MDDVLKLSYLLASKMCHDLATPLGAMSLGVDMSGDPEMDEMMRHSLDAANLKLKFYRTLLTPTDRAPHLGEVVQYLKDYAKAHNIQVIWGPVDADEFQGTPARLLLGLTHIAMETLLKGGSVHLSCVENTLTIEARGNPCQLRDTYLAALTSQDLTLSVQNARTIMPYYLLCLANLIDAGITFDYQEHISITFFLTLKDG
jgi:histidine phosphotransferase ChpT